MRLRAFAASAALLGLALVSSVCSAARPDLDITFLSRAPRTPALDRLRSDLSLGKAGGPLHIDERYGVPSFLWAGAASSPAPTARAGRRLTPEDAARQHLARVAPYYALDDGDVRDATLHSLHDTGSGGIIASFRSTFDGVEVFRDEMKVMMDRSLNLVAVSGFLPGRAETGTPASRAFRMDAGEAVGRALDDFTGHGFDRSAIRRAGPADGGYETFALGASGDRAVGLETSEPIRVRRVFFHRPGRLEPAFYVEVMTEKEALSYVVSADDGALLFRRDLMQNDAFSYRVWADGTLRAPFDGPQGNGTSPHPTGLPDLLNPGFVAPVLITLQNGPISTNDPWLAAGATTTSGNNVDAFVDLTAPDGFSGTDFRASTTSANTFDRTYDLTQAPGVSANQRMAAITQLFYDNNFFHDWFYDVGFNEVSGNAQTNNYGRGGIQGDNLRAEAQDYSGTNNANMSTPADGGRPRMQMYVFNLTGARLTLNSPGSIAGNRLVGSAVFGPQTYNVTGDVVLVTDNIAPNPNDGCEAFANSVAGKIALIDRGSCTFASKIEKAQNAGAIGVIIVNNIAPGTITMGGTPTITITIPSQMVSLSDGIDVKHALLGGPVNATLFAQAALSRDGTIDNTIVAHEWGHYISNRLIGNASGLNNQQGGGMGEGWGDFHALLMLVKAEDALVASNPNYSGVYGEAAYAQQNSQVPDNAYYFGFRRYPYSTDLNKNPLTFKHIQNGVALPVGPPVSFGADGANNAEVHATGEAWCTMLWECYASLLRDTGRLTFDQARDRMRAYLVAGYKMTPSSPTFVEARDAVLAAALAGDPADYNLFCAAFAKRGAGVGALAPPRTSADNVGVTESYAICGGDLRLSSTVLDDAVQNCDADGVLDESEGGHFTVMLQNVGTNSLTGTTAMLSSTNPSVIFTGGSSLSFPSSAPNATTSAFTTVRSIDASGIQSQDIQVQFNDPGLAFAGPRSASFAGRGNTDETPSANETVEAANPTWTMAGPVATAWRRVAIAALDHRFLAPDATGVSDQSLVSPALSVGASPLSFSFRHAHSFEASSSSFRDGGVIEISTDGGGSWTDIGASASPGYNGTLTTVSGNPLGGRPAFVGQSPGYPALALATVSLGTTYAGQTVQIRFRAAADQATGGPGWSVDDVNFTGLSNTPFLDVIADPGPCIAVAVGDGAPREVSFALAGGNPVSGRAGFRFDLPRKTRVRITIHDVAGRRVATLADGEFQAGSHSAWWNDTSANSAPRAGVYFARMAADGKEFRTRVVLLSR